MEDLKTYRFNGMFAAALEFLMQEGHIKEEGEVAKVMTCSVGTISKYKRNRRRISSKSQLVEFEKTYLAPLKLTLEDFEKAPSGPAEEKSAIGTMLIALQASNKLLLEKMDLVLKENAEIKRLLKKK